MFITGFILCWGYLDKLKSCFAHSLATWHFSNKVFFFLIESVTLKKTFYSNLAAYCVQTTNPVKETLYFLLLSVSSTFLQNWSLMFYKQGNKMDSVRTKPFHAVNIFSAGYNCCFNSSIWRKPCFLLSKEEEQKKNTEMENGLENSYQ